MDSFDDADSNEYARKLRESQERQQRIMEKIAEKEQKLGMSTASWNENANSSGAPTWNAVDPLVTTTLEAEEKSLARLKEQANAIRLIKTESARKDQIINQLRIQVQELQNAHSKVLNQAKQWELVDQQHRMREDGMAQQLQTMKLSSDQQTQLENTLRNQISALQREKLQQERSFQLTMSDMEAKLAAERAQVEKKELQRKKLEHDLGIVQREQAKQKKDAEEFEHSQLGVQHQIEEKVFQLKKTKAEVESKLEEASLSNEDLKNRVRELEETLEMRALEYQLLNKAKEAQVDVVNSLQRELRDNQELIIQLKAESGQIPRLRQEIEELSKLRSKIRDEQSRNAEVTAQLRQCKGERVASQEEAKRLMQLNRELEQHLQTVRDRYTELIAPGSEFSRAKQQVQYLTAEIEKHRTKAKTHKEEVDAAQEVNMMLETRFDQTNNEVMVELSNLQKMVDLLVAGDDTPINENKAKVPPQLLQHAEGVRRVVVALKASCVGLMISLQTLRAEQRELSVNFANLNRENDDRGRELEHTQTDLKQMCEQLNEAQVFIKELQAELEDTKHNLNQTQTQLRNAQVVLEERCHHMESISAQSYQLYSMLMLDAPSDGLLPITSALTIESCGSWNSLKDSLTEQMFASQSRARQILSEFAETRRKLTSAEEEIVMKNDHLKQVVTENAEDMQRMKERHSEEQETQRHNAELKYANLLSEHNTAVEDFKSNKKALEGVIEELKENESENHKTITQQQQRITVLSDVITQLANTSRLLYRGYAPLRTQVAELSSQKRFLTKENIKLESLRVETEQLMKAMTGELKFATPSEYRSRIKESKATFRSAVIAVIAANRLTIGAKRHAHYGKKVNVRGRAFQVLPDYFVSQDDNIPDSDTSSDTRSALSLASLHSYFSMEEKQNFSSHGTLLSHLALGYYKFRTHLPLIGGSESKQRDVTYPVMVVRKIALNLATRIRDVEREYKITSAEKLKALEDFTQEQQRANKLSDLQNINQQTIGELEHRVKELQHQTLQMIPLGKYELLRKDLETLNHRLMVAEADKKQLQRELGAKLRQIEEATERIQSLEGDFRSAVGKAESKDLELSELQAYMRRKANEVVELEKERHQRTDQMLNAQKNLDSCMMKNKALVERLEAAERTIKEERENLHHYQQKCISMDGGRQHFEGIIVRLKTEVKDKDRELRKAQDMLKALGQAHKVATNHATQLDSQLNQLRYDVIRSASPRRSSDHSSVPSSQWRNQYELGATSNTGVTPNYGSQLSNSLRHTLNNL